VAPWTCNNQPFQVSAATQNLRRLFLHDDRTKLPESGDQVSLGGVFTANGALGLSNAHVGREYCGVMSNFPPSSQTFTAPDTNGRGRLFMPGGRVFTYYIISAKVLRMLEGDNIDLDWRKRLCPKPLPSLPFPENLSSSIPAGAPPGAR